MLASSLAVSVANFTVWFAVTFWVYLETRSVFATGVIAGMFLVATAGTGTWFGSLVDHHRKHAVIQASAVASFVFYAIGPRRSTCCCRRRCGATRRARCCGCSSWC